MRSFRITRGHPTALLVLAVVSGLQAQDEPSKSDSSANHWKDAASTYRITLNTSRPTLLKLREEPALKWTNPRAGPTTARCSCGPIAAGPRSPPRSTGTRPMGASSRTMSPSRSRHPHCRPRLATNRPGPWRPASLPRSRSPTLPSRRPPRTKGSGRCEPWPESSRRRSTTRPTSPRSACSPSPSTASRPKGRGPMSSMGPCSPTSTPPIRRSSSTIEARPNVEGGPVAWHYSLRPDVDGQPPRAPQGEGGLVRPVGDESQGPLGALHGPDVSLESLTTGPDFVVDSGLTGRQVSVQGVTPPLLERAAPGFVDSRRRSIALSGADMLMSIPGI